MEQWRPLALEAESCQTRVLKQKSNSKYKSDHESLLKSLLTLVIKGRLGCLQKSLAPKVNLNLKVANGLSPLNGFEVMR